MEIPQITDVGVDSATRTLLDDLDHLKAIIDAARPLDNPTVAQLRSELLGEQVHNSNAIEGNVLSLRETRAILESGQVIDIGKPRDSQEALNLGRAIDCIQSSLDGPPRFSDETFFRDVHRVLFTDLDDGIAGQYRRDRVMLTGAKHQPPQEFESTLTKMFVQLSQSTESHSVVTATWAHWAIARLHPFMDGNGRMARLWQNFILLAHHYTPAVIPQTQRTQYYAALQEADDGDFSDLLLLVVQSALATSQVYVNTIREADEAADWADALVGESEQLTDERHRLDYSRWQARVDELRDAFQKCLTLISRKSSHLEFELHSYPMIDQSTWEILRSGPHASQTWCFRIDGRSDAGRFRYVFFAGKHFRSEMDDDLNLTGPHACLLVSEKANADESVILKDDASPVSLRELLIVDGEFIRKRWDPAARKLVYDRSLSSLNIAQDFVTEIVRHRLTPR